jgi:choline dehydrogenase-like flavoprotein
LWVGSASVFPTMSSANPTLTLMLLMLRLGDHLAKLRKP